MRYYKSINKLPSNEFLDLLVLQTYLYLSPVIIGLLYVYVIFIKFYMGLYITKKNTRT